MAIKNIIAMGIGFAPGSVKFMPTLGFSISAVTVPTKPGLEYASFGRAHYTVPSSLTHYTVPNERPHYTARAD